MAQYRAIFNNAYFKGLASAAIVTVAMAAGQAHAAELNANTAATIEEATKLDSIVTKEAENTLTIDSTKKYVNGITVTKDTKLTVASDFVSVADVAVNGTLDIAQGKSLLLASTEDADQNNAPVYDKKLTVNSGATLTMAGNIGAHSFSVSEATLTLSSGGTNGTNLTAHGERVGETAPTKYDGQGTLTKVTATLGDASNITAIGKLDVNEGTIKLQGKDQNSDNKYYKLTFLEGSRNLNINKANIEVTNAKNALSGRNIVISNGAKLSLADSAALTIGTDFDVKAFASDSLSGTAIEGNIAIKDSTVTLGSGSILNFGYTGSAASVAFEGKNTIANKGTANFYTPTTSMSAADLNALVKEGKIDFKTDASTLNVSGELDLNANGVIKSDDGTLVATKLAVSGNKLDLNGDKVTLGTKYAAANLDITTKDLVVGKGFSQSKQTLTVTNSLTGVDSLTVSGDSVAATLNLKDGGSVSGINAITLQGTSANGALNVTGTWTGLDKTALNIGNSGAASLTDATLTIKDLDVKTGGALNLDNSKLTVKETVKNAQQTTGVDLKNNSSLSVSYAKVTTTNDAPNKTDIAQSFTLDGTSTLVLTGREQGEITKAKLDALKEAFLGKNGKGLFKVEGATLSKDESGIKDDNTVDFNTAEGNAGYADLYDKVTVTGVDTSTALTSTNDWGAAQLADGKTELDIGAAGTVTLNGVGNADTALVSKKGANNTYEAADVKFSDAAATLNVQGNGGTLNKITAGAANNGKVLVGATLNVKEDIGANGTSVAELNVQNKGTVNAANVYSQDLNVAGTLNTSGDVVVGNANNIADISGVLNAGGNVTVGASGADISGQVIALGEGKSFKSAGDVAITGSLKATDLTLTAKKDVSVGDADNTGFLEVQTLTLADGMLLLDPSFKQPTTFAAVTGKDLETNDAINVSGDIGVGMNSVLAIGTTVDNANALVSRLGYMNGQALNEKTGAVLVADNVISIANGDKVLLDPTKTKDELKTALGTTTPAADSFTVAKGGALVVTEALTQKSLAGNAIIEFATPATAKVDFAAGSTLQFDTGLTAKDTIKLTNATTADKITLDGDIIAANGLLSGLKGDNAGEIKFTLQKDEARKKLTAQSKPVQELTLNALNGDYDKSEIGVDYILLNAGINGGKSIEGTANLALYGGVVQGTSLAQQAANDAVVERMNRSNPNGSLVFANNAQGGGLWLSPVYKSHESDSFDADGVDYGVDGDLTGLVLGADSTSESGVRVGGYFNFGSASFDGQGVGDQVSNDADYFGFGLYAGMTAGQFSLLADAGFTQVSNDIEQNADHGKYSKVTADVDSTTVTLGLRGEYKLNVATMDVTPHLGVRYTRLAIDSYDAKHEGEILATTDFDTMQMFSIPFGVTVSKDIAAGAWTIKPVFDLTLTANAGDTDAKLNTTFIGTRAVDLTSEAFDSFTYGATFDLDAKYGENFSIGLNTNYTGSSNADEFGVMGNARYMF